MKLTWILVADSTHARIFTAENPSSALIEIEGLTHAESRLHDRQLTADLPGKNKSANGGGHAFEQATDPKKHEADNFAHTLSKHLERAHIENEFEQLLIVADPAFLGLLRNCLSEQIRKLVCFELDKNITMHDTEDIRKHLPTYLPHL